jgi:drug/metabolite transporter (DMT)-like permease
LPVPSERTMLAVLGLAALSTALAYVIFFRIMAVSGSTNVMLVTLLIPVSAIWMGATFLGERLEPRHIAGALVIALSLVVIDGRALSLLRRR